MKICFETFGCRLNRAEALKDEAKYLAAGHQRTESHADADWIIVRGCSVTAHAQKDCEKLIAHLKRKYPRKQIAVTGCLKVKGTTTPPPSVKVAEPATPTRTARAYLKVQDGCDCSCTFCIVPQFRGKSAATAFTDVMDEARRFLDAGYHEIVVTGCNLALYRSENRGLPELLAALAELSSEARIRLGSIAPGPCAMEVVKVMAEHDNFCRFLHLPIQSGSDSVLTAMKRPYRIKDIHALITAATKAMPTLGLGCDIMTGFPGETGAEFIATKTLLTRHPFSNVHVFPYSERPDTPAATMVGSISKSIRSSRAHDISKLIGDKRQLFARSFIGRNVEVVIEHETKNSGWTGEYLPCKVMHRGNCQPIRRKELVSATVVDYSDGRLLATQNL